MTDKTAARQAIAEGRTALGVEFGSTNIKAVLIDEQGHTLASGSHGWENQFNAERIWTYPLDAVWTGLQDAYAQLSAQVEAEYGQPLEQLAAIGFSAMMHGYLAFDEAGQLLVPFRTWRNTITEPACEVLTPLFQYNIPQRWSIAHLYQAILNGEPHVPQIGFQTTLAGYVHWQLTGRQVLGVGDASGMFPIDPATGTYYESMLDQFDELVATQVPWRLRDILPAVLPAGQAAGTLTEAGAKLIDPSGRLKAGIPLCPPEGDAGTGMVATNAVAPRSGNVSAGTSIFAMIVLERALQHLHTEIDLVTTPAGDAVAMVHCNNGASELDAWAGVFGEFAAALGAPAEANRVFETLFRASLAAEADAGGLLAYNYLAGEPITATAEGRPLILRLPDSRLTLANFMRAQIYSVFGTLQLGMRILAGENVALDSMFAHGGLFKTEGVAQRFLAAALGAPVTVGTTAGEGGAWGMAVLAAFLQPASHGVTLPGYLNDVIFAGVQTTTWTPTPEDQAGFTAFMKLYEAGLAAERVAAESV